MNKPYIPKADLPEQFRHLKPIEKVA